MPQEINTEKVRIRKLENGILENYFKAGCTIEADDFYSLRKLNLGLANNKPYVVLVEAGDLTNFSKEARELIASKRFAGITVAKALLIKSLGQRMIGNFYLQVNRPYIHTKLFTDRNEALKWLRQQLSDHRAALGVT
ncbi:MAG TPA: hypothetical protein PLQ93_03965 [Bacteroidia bacterium]|nr:hypothetical protein [Bacteroidia bacterium]